MLQNSRRHFLSQVGQGMFVASVGSSLAVDLGLCPQLLAEEGPGRLNFGKLEPLVSLMQETPPAKLQPMLIEKLRAGMELSQLVAAAALANARTFGGEDYVGFHTMMRQSVHYCVKNENPNQASYHSGLRVMLPKLLDRYALIGRPLGTKMADD